MVTSILILPDLGLANFSSAIDASRRETEGSHFRCNFQHAFVRVCVGGSSCETAATSRTDGLLELLGGMSIIRSQNSERGVATAVEFKWLIQVGNRLRYSQRHGGITKVANKHGWFYASKNRLGQLF